MNPRTLGPARVRLSHLAGHLIVGLTALGLGLGLFARSAESSGIDTVRVLGFESAADWTATAGVLQGTSTERTEGDGSLAFLPSGYSSVESRLIGPLGSVPDTISFDLKLPTDQPNPYWYGAAQLFVSVPSLGVYNAYVGQRELTGLEPGTFSELEFQLDPALRETLSGNYNDLVVKVVLNAPSGMTEPYLLDRLRMSAGVPDDSTITEADIPRILGMESLGDWTGTGTGSMSLSNTHRTSGNTSLRLPANGWMTVKSAPMPSLAPVSENLTVDLHIPVGAAAGGWAGALQLYVEAPSLNITNQFVGSVELAGLAEGQFHTLSFPLNAALRAQLNTVGPTDFRVIFALNVPAGPRFYYLDNCNVGPETTPPAPLDASSRHDYVGRTSSGVLLVVVDDTEASPHPPLVDAIIKAKADAGQDCIPSSTQACSYLFTQVLIRTGAFSVGDTTLANAFIRNQTPWRVNVGGAYGFTSLIPRSVPFLARLDDGNNVIQVSPTGVRLTFDPRDDGHIDISGAFTGQVDDTSLVLWAMVTADSPLVNRMPLADAGPDQSLSSTSCSVVVQLDASGSTDPDGNLMSTWWTANGQTVAQGASASVELTRSGLWTFSARVQDTFYSWDTDETLVNVALPPECGSL